MFAIGPQRGRIARESRPVRTHSSWQCANSEASGAGDRVAPVDHPAAHDLSAQPAAMDERLADAFAREFFEMAARLAESDAAQHDLMAHLELAADEVVERHAARQDVSA